MTRPETILLCSPGPDGEAVVELVETCLFSLP